jgi:hypothetical protein
VLSVPLLGIKSPFETAKPAEAWKVGMREEGSGRWEGRCKEPCAEGKIVHDVTN